MTVAVLVATMAPLHATAATQDASLELWPHCTGGGEVDNVFGGPFPDSPHFVKLTEDKCYPFQAKDPLTRQTQVLDEGDELDMDLILRNPSAQDIRRFRAWIAYDPTILQGVDVAINPVYAMPTPGETDFSPEEGFVKLGATADSAVRDTFIAIARIKMKIIGQQGKNTVMSFYDVNGDANAHTFLLDDDDDDAESALKIPLGSLLVRLQGADGDDDGAGDDTGGDDDDDNDDDSDDAASSDAGDNGAASSAGTDTSMTGDTQSSASSQAAAATELFSLLQVQNLRATTEGTTVFLAWDALISSELANYNVYYGTVSGQYAHRRTIDGKETTLTVRNLQAGKTYYFAVRGLSRTGEESQFSQEVGITVGNPASSTSPLTSSIIRGGPNGNTPGTNGNLAGDTGLPSTLMLFLAASAVIGMSLALRRQFTASAARV